MIGIQPAPNQDFGLSQRQQALLSSYLMNLPAGPDHVEDLMDANVRRLLGMGARSSAGEHLTLRRLFKTARRAALEQRLSCPTFS